MAAPVDVTVFLYGLITFVLPNRNPTPPLTNIGNVSAYFVEHSDQGHGNHIPVMIVPAFAIKTGTPDFTFWAAKDPTSPPVPYAVWTLKYKEVAFKDNATTQVAIDARGKPTSILDHLVDAQYASKKYTLDSYLNTKKGGVVIGGGKLESYDTTSTEWLYCVLDANDNPTTTCNQDGNKYLAPAVKWSGIVASTIQVDGKDTVVLENKTTVVITNVPQNIVDMDERVLKHYQSVYDKMLKVPNKPDQYIPVNPTPTPTPTGPAPTADKSKPQSKAPAEPAKPATKPNPCVTPPTGHIRPDTCPPAIAFTNN